MPSTESCLVCDGTQLCQTCGGGGDDGFGVCPTCDGEGSCLHGEVEMETQEFGTAGGAKAAAKTHEGNE